VSRRFRPGLRGAPADVVDDLRRRRITPHRVESATTKRDFIEAVAAALDFPAWTGRNWDALVDALGDLSWLPRGPHALVWSRPEALRAADPAAYQTGVRLLRDAADASAGTDRPLTVLLLRGND